MPIYNVFTEVTLTESRTYQIEAESEGDAKRKIEAAKFDLPFESTETSENNDEEIHDIEEAE